MSARKLLEGDVDLILEKIKADIAAALAAVRADRADAEVTTEPPQSYFTYPNAIGYKTPAVFVVCDRVDFRKAEKGANHIAALAFVDVTVLVEDRTAERLTTKAYRYLAALHEVLDQIELESSDNKLKLFVRVARAENSPLFSNSKNQNSNEAVFRKEVHLACEVEHFENF